jgi:dsDNA-specific endonuclease/ATPase MutS2
MIPEEEHLKEELARLEEMGYLLARYGRLPIDVSSDLTRAVELAQKGGVLSVEDLEKAANDVFKKRACSISSARSRISPLLLAYVANFPHLEFLEKDIHKVIAPDLTIYDNASPKLKSVRLAITHLENEMKKKLGFVLDRTRSIFPTRPSPSKTATTSCRSPTRIRTKSKASSRMSLAVAKPPSSNRKSWLR